MIVGLVVSVTTTLKLQFAVFDEPSVTVNTTFVVPTPTIVPGAGTWVTEATEQLSAAVANPL